MQCVHEAVIENSLCHALFVHAVSSLTYQQGLFYAMVRNFLECNPQKRDTQTYNIIVEAGSWMHIN